MLVYGFAAAPNLHFRYNYANRPVVSASGRATKFLNRGFRVAAEPLTEPAEQGQ